MPFLSYPLLGPRPPSLVPLQESSGLRGASSLFPTTPIASAQGVEKALLCLNLIHAQVWFAKKTPVKKAQLQSQVSRIKESCLPSRTAAIVRPHLIFSLFSSWQLATIRRCSSEYNFLIGNPSRARLGGKAEKHAPPLTLLPDSPQSGTFHLLSNHPPGIPSILWQHGSR